MFTAEIRPVDFLQEVSEQLAGNLFSPPLPTFTAAILNPPYRKIHSKSATRECLRRIGIETSNLCTGFLEAAICLLAPDAELVSITLRSFRNGTYFRRFHKAFLEEMALRQRHLFDSRKDVFREDKVLPETVIVSAAKTKRTPDRVGITLSSNAEEKRFLSRTLADREVVHEHDAEYFIRIVPDDASQQIVHRMGQFGTSLTELGLKVSTGRVVDFRAAAFLRERPSGKYRSSSLSGKLGERGGRLAQENAQAPSTRFWSRNG